MNSLSLILPAPTAIQLTLGLVYRHHGRGTVCNATSIRCSEAMDSDQVGVIIVLPQYLCPGSCDLYMCRPSCYHVICAGI